MVIGNFWLFQIDWKYFTNVTLSMFYDISPRKKSEERLHVRLKIYPWFFFYYIYLFSVRYFSVNYLPQTGSKVFMRPPIHLNTNGDQTFLVFGKLDKNWFYRLHRYLIPRISKNTKGFSVIMSPSKEVMCSLNQSFIR
jgi:hypothetical protein